MSLGEPKFLIEEEATSVKKDESGAEDGGGGEASKQIDQSKVKQSHQSGTHPVVQCEMTATEFFAISGSGRRAFLARSQNSEASPEPQRGSHLTNARSRSQALLESKSGSDRHPVSPQSRKVPRS
jgi:hypothetical protein